MSAGPAFSPKLYSQTIAIGTRKNSNSQNSGAPAIAANGRLCCFQSCSPPATDQAARTRVKASSYFD